MEQAKRVRKPWPLTSQPAHGSPREPTGRPAPGPALSPSDSDPATWAPGLKPRAAAAAQAEPDRVPGSRGLGLPPPRPPGLPWSGT